jgi:hypothetical protein
MKVIATTDSVGQTLRLEPESPFEESIINSMNAPRAVVSVVRENKDGVPTIALELSMSNQR